MKSLLIYGDSISSGIHGKNAYLSYLERTLHCFIINRSIGSSGLTWRTPRSMLEQLENFIDEHVDIILIWHGTNDWYWGVPMDVFIDGINEAITTLQKRNPLALITWCGPIYRFEAPNGTITKGSAFSNKNKSGLTLYDYTQAIKETSEKLHFTYINMDELAQIHQWNEQVFLEDHVHPNADGYVRIGRILSTTLQNLWFIKTGEQA